MNQNLKPSETILHLLTSIRGLDARIDELKYLILNKYLKPEAEFGMKKRIENLIHTRGMLVNSLMDNKLAFEKFIGEETSLSYDILKREIKEK